MKLFFGLVFVLALGTGSLYLRGQSKTPLLQSGPMVGHVDLVEAVLWVQTTQSAEVVFEYWNGENPRKKSPSLQTVAEDYFIAKITVTDLQPATRYQYRVFLNGVEQERAYAQEFKTQVFWKYRTEPPDIKFAIGSCMYVNDPPFDRPGKPYGGDFHTLKSLYRQKPDFMIWLGDNLYLRESDFYSKVRLNYRYRHARSLAELQPLLARNANYAIWDDHDFGPNNSHRGYAFKGETLRLFSHYWANPHFGTPDTPGSFGHLEWGDLDFFLMDDRSYRAPNELKDPRKPFLGAKQLQWLKDNLASSRASFKFIAIGNQVLNRYNSYESYSLYKEEHNHLLAWLDSAQISGVIFLSGDRHHTELLKYERPRNYPLYEFTSSPLTSGTGSDLGSEKNNPLRVPGTLVLGKRNFGTLQVTGTKGKRVLLMQAFDSQGQKLWEHQIQQAELTK